MGCLTFVLLVSILKPIHIISGSECNDQGVEFLSEPTNITKVCRPSEVATIPCQYTTTTHVSTPRWIINGTEYYGSFDDYLPPDHSYSNNILTVTNLRYKDGSTYQCRLVSLEECKYNSKEAYLICEVAMSDCPLQIIIDIQVQCLPFYKYDSHKLTGIKTTIIHSGDFESVHVTYKDSDSDRECHSSPSLPCDNDGMYMCYHMIDTSLYCQDALSITVTVSSTSDVSYPMPHPIKIDTINNFVRIDFTPTSFTCAFINQDERSDKYCKIVYDSITPGCKNLTRSLESTSDSSHVTIELDSAENGICFIAIASNGTNNITVEGVSLTGSSTVIHHNIIASKIVHNIILASLFVYLYQS